MTTPQEAATSTIVAPQVLLGDHLKALKLPTFAREFEKVAMESAQDRADYPRYLLRLCELERIDRERRAIERRIRLARFPRSKASTPSTSPPSLRSTNSWCWSWRAANGSRNGTTESPLDPPVPARPTSPWR